MPQRKKLQPSIEKFIKPYYEHLFDEMPEFPARRMALGAAISPAYTEKLEDLRAEATFHGPIEEKCVQLMAVSHLAARGSAGTYWHCKAARKFGATWEEIHQAIEISAFFNGFSAINEGGQALVKLYNEEQAMAAKTKPKARQRAAAARKSSTRTRAKPKAKR